MIQRFLFFASLLLLSTNPILAHGSHGTGFTAGISHPIFGLDHLLAILGLAILAFHTQETKKWLPSAAFIISMIIAAHFGINHSPLAITESVILGSVVVFGLLLTLGGNLMNYLLVGLSVIAGFFHGHAHGTEMPEDSNIALYVLGFTVGATIISLVGALIGNKVKNPLLIKFIGGVLIGIAISMLF